MSTVLEKKIRNKKARVAVLGLGYVGLPLAIQFAKAGFTVTGLDKDKDRVERILKKENYISDVKQKDFLSVLKNGRFTASVDSKFLKEADIIVICVPTPLKRKYTPDVSYIVGAIRDMRKYLRKDTLIVLESTTYPGTTNEMMKPEIEKSGLKVGKDIFLSFSPERIDPGNKKHDVTRIPKVVGGITPRCGELTKLFYNNIIREIHLVTSAKAAEMTKLLENSFRIINIGWINEVAMMCHKLGIDVWEVIEAAKTKPFGFMPFYPGLGVGGHCIPDDPLYLYWKAKQYGFSSKYIKLSADTNSAMTLYAVVRVEELLADSGVSLKKAKVLVLGATYKKDVKDLRKSPSLKLIEHFQSAGAAVDYYDPIIPFLEIGPLHMKSIRLTASRLKQYDCVVIATDHTDVNYDLILKSSKRIFDTKNVYGRKKNKKITKI